MVKKSLLTTLIIFSLSACSNIKLIHEPVGCLGSPKISLGFTQSELKPISKEARQKLVVFIKTLRLRIDAQCELNTMHDAQYID